MDAVGTTGACAGGIDEYLAWWCTVWSTTE
jgi:hypothetical protein